ncbi:MAG: asparagine synthase (glutamine-hydrolyzing) [Phycisphaerae bacterium]|nr:asparagine synthase (glutamine-hydrolyzing) [Phycisphaerae bacterium]
MCGIAGICGAPDEDALTRAVRRLAHRGPDGDGVWIDPRREVGLAHTRLAVIDLPGGAQPIFNEDGSVAVVFNGEIYNYVELRADLIARGHTFTTQTDTEVLVHLYEEHGDNLLAQLRGMFALAIWDRNRSRLLLARDRLGVKPLYYAEIGSRLMFASEIKGLLALGIAPLTIDDQALSDYLTFGHVPAPATIYNEIRTLPPGCRLVADRPAGPRVERYWSLPCGPCDEISTEQAVERVETVLDEAVRIRLRADVPVGVFLSGGIDSGLITAYAARHAGRSITTLAAGFEDEMFDERPLARLVAERYGTDHHEIVVRPDPERVLPRIVAAYDQPYADSSAIPSYCLSELARRHLKVVLNGDGGDEALAGYRRYVASWAADRLGPLAGIAGRGLWCLADKTLPDPGGFRTSYAFVRRLIRGLALPEPRRILAWGNDGLDESAKRRLTGRQAGWLDRCQPTWQRVADLLANGSTLPTNVDRQMWVDAQTLLPDDLLIKMDIATMAHGLEARSPLLDHVLFETVARFPACVKLNSPTTKPILRALAERYLPAEVAHAPKRGFEVPLVRWLEGELRPLRNDLLLHPTGLIAERFDASALADLVRSQSPDRARWARQVWTLMMLGQWDRQRTEGMS